MIGRALMAAMATALVVACDSPQEPARDALAVAAVASGASLHASGASLHASGGGHYLLAGAFPMQFGMTAVQQPNGGVAGEFHQRGDVGGVWVEVHGRVTCLAVDPVSGRAWIGGVVTRNRSDPDLQDPIHQPGQDVWFRVVDYGAGAAAPPDRTSFLGFTGAAGIITSEEYCAARIWPDNDERTHPVTRGNIQVAGERP